MRLSTRSQIRYLRFAPWSTLTVLLGISLAVSSIVAVHQIGRQVVASLAGVMPAYLDDVAYLIDRPSLAMTDYFELRARWRQGALPEVAGLMPLVDGNVLTDQGVVSVVGVDAFSGVPAVAGLALVTHGTLVVGTAFGVAAGDSLVVNGEPHRIGLVHASVPERMVVTDIGTAQILLGRNDEALDRIAVVVDPALRRLEDWGERLLPGLSAGVRLPGWTLSGWRVQPVDVSLPDLAFARSVLFNLGALGSLALVVAWLLVYQVSVIWLRRRALMLTRLAQLGMSHRELRNGFLANLLLLGGLAAAVGLWTGQLLAFGLSRAATGYGNLGVAVPALDTWVVGKAIASAVAVCVVGGWFAYRRERLDAAPSAARWILPAALLVLAAFGLAGTDSLLGAFVAIGAIALLALLGISPMLRLLKRFATGARGGLLVRSGVRELVWYPADLAVAVGALVLALATSVAIAVMVDSFRGDFERMLDQRLAHDLFIDGGGRDLGELAGVLAGLPGVQHVQRYGSQDTQLLGRQLNVSFTRFDGRESRRYGLEAPLAAGEAIVSERLSRALGLVVGQEIPELGLRVAGIFPGFGDAAPRLLIDETDAVRLGLPLRHERLGVDAADPAVVVDAVGRAAAGASVQRRDVVRGRALAVFDQTFTITNALTLLALVVAAVGLYNALLALALLRQRTRQLFDAMGVSRVEQRRVDAGRTLAVCAFVLLLAVPLGLVMGALLCEVVNPRAFGWSIALAPGVGAITMPVILALGVSLLASLLPVPAEEIPDAE
ncbi:MAG: FtsX-like permease family protein [Pseudomonadales bacterium]